MGKKPAMKMSMAELSTKFGGDPMQGLLPTRSEGKDFGKSKGKGFRDSEDSRAEQSEWRSGGRGGDRFGGKGGRDRDSDSRAETGDWFAKDRPAGGGRDDDRSGRPGGGGGGFMRRDDRRGGEDTISGKDSDWRRREEGDGDRPRFGRGNSGFGDRDRRDDGPRRGDDTPSERPKLNLKPRSKPVEGGSKDADDTPARKDNERAPRKDDEEDDAGWAEVKKPSGKYVPPTSRKKDDEDEDRKRRDERPARRRDEDERPQRDSDRPRKKEESGSSALGSSGGRYVPAHLRKQQEEEAKRKEAEEAKEREKLEKQRQLEEERVQAETARKKELKEKKEERKASRKTASREVNKENEKNNNDHEMDSALEKLGAFSEECASLIEDDSADIEDSIEEATEMLTEDDLKTLQPMNRLFARLLKHCRGKDDEDVVAVVQRFEPLISYLISKAPIHRFKMKMLIEAQKLAYEMGLPRLSPKSALLEVFFDGLYSAEIIEEEYFNMWALADDDTPGKTSAMFQVNDFLDFLRTATIEGEESEEEDLKENEESEMDDEEEEEDDGSDIEANVPKRVGAR
mmetsp:Transcript_72965/g.202450  ORF Transcript_72965/g.202450 Transcript_72965/m.202450 type:complete len:570 (-) Transcript_72965:188-1897(-)